MRVVYFRHLVRVEVRESRPQELRSSCSSPSGLPACHVSMPGTTAVITAVKACLEDERTSLLSHSKSTCKGLSIVRSQNRQSLWSDVLPIHARGE
jgi:hypothetical protein